MRGRRGWCRKQRSEAEGKSAREVRSVGNTVAMLAGRERIEGIQQIEVAWSRVPGAESTRLHTAHPKPVPLLLVHSLAHSPYSTFFLYRLFGSPSCPPADTHPRYPFPLIPFLTVVSSLCFSSLHRSAPVSFLPQVIQFV